MLDYTHPLSIFPYLTIQSLTWLTKGSFLLLKSLIILRRSHKSGLTKSITIIEIL